MAKFIAQVFVVVEAADQSEACDAMTGALSETLKYDGAIIEWAYTKADGLYVYPKILPEPFASADIDDMDLDAPFKAAMAIPATEAA